ATNRALSPPATIAAQTKQPVTIPTPDHRAGRGPSLAAVLSTNAVSSPGVIVSSAATTVYASSVALMECMCQHSLIHSKISPPPCRYGLTVRRATPGDYRLPRRDR